MATVAGIVVHCVTGLIGWTATIMSTRFSWFDIVDYSSCRWQMLAMEGQHQQQMNEGNTDANMIQLHLFFFFQLHFKFGNTFAVS